MNWLSFFMGVTAAWVFMGLIIFVIDIFRKDKNNINTALMDYWESAIDNQDRQVEILKDLVEIIGNQRRSECTTKN